MATKLPNIHQRQRSAMADSTNMDLKDNSGIALKQQYYISPFRLPTDDEVFVYRELERKKRDELKLVTQDLKIWDKKTATSRKPLRLFKSFDAPMKENMKAHQSYNSKEKSAIVEAQQIINERRKSRDVEGRQQKEGIVELLDQKKEMFLVQMTVGILEKEKETLTYKAGEKEEALKKSEGMLEKDKTEFEKYKLNNKQETDQAIQTYNQEAELRKKTEIEYKIKNNDLTSLKAEKTKNEELSQKYYDAKNFLDKLTPTEFLEQKERELNEKIEDFKAQWIEREISIREETQSTISDSNTKGVTNKRNGRKNNRNDLDKLFADKLEKGEFEEIEEFKLNQKMYFTDTEQLIELFTKLEEENVSLIQTMQETEQGLENLRTILNLKKLEFDKKIVGLRDNKAQLEKNKKEKENKIRHLLMRSKEPQLNKKYDILVPVAAKITKLIKMFKDDMKGLVDLDNSQPLDLLTVLELHLGKQLEELNSDKMDRVLVATLKKKCENERKAENRRLQLERENKAAEEKRAKANERLRQKPKKRLGRVDMLKSSPLEKKTAVVEVVKNNEEEEDMKASISFKE